MDGSHSQERDSMGCLASKKRKVDDKTVVRVRIAENASNLKNEGPPSDSWSWRKYGQKPIKGSPYPRGYYRCSTSKGCSAKKQVERCKTDASMLIITYTSSHNHPGPDLPKSNPNQPSNEHPQVQSQTTKDHHPSNLQTLKHPHEEVKQDQPIMTSPGKNSDFHYLESPLRTNQEDPFVENSGNGHEHEAISILFDEDPISCTELMTFSNTTPKSEENDFFDELEELPISSPFTSFMRGNIFEETIHVVPS